VVPTLIHDGQPVIESSVILYYLEDCFPDVRLMPEDPTDRVTVRLFNKFIDEYVHNACTVLTFAIAFRTRFQKMDPVNRESYLSGAPNQKRSDYKRDVIAQGLDSKFCVEAVGHFIKLLQWIKRATLDHDYLAGDELSLADIAVIPYVIRLDMLRLAPMLHSYPHVAAWYERTRKRPAVERAIVSSMTAVDRAPFEEISVDPWPAIVRMVGQA
jgi:glutathione S-transferase